jgi:hypothetical protein
MSSYSYTANSTNQQTPVLKKGPVRIFAAVNVYWTVGENPTINTSNSAMLNAGETREIRLPVKCSKIAIQAVNTPGLVTVTEISGGAKASCS